MNVIMENNEEFKVNNTELNNNENKPQKNNGKTIVLIIITMILVLAIGVGVGLLLANIDKNNNNNNANSTETQTKTSKKVDESKDWVYDAEYGNNKPVKTTNSWNSNEVLSSKEDLVVPYININSEAGKNANREIEIIYEEMYNKYATNIGIEGNNVDVKTMTRLKYKYYKNNNILSVIIEESNYVIPGGAGRCPLYVYNFNLDTLEKASSEELAKQTGYNSIAEVNEIVNKWFTKEKTDEENNEGLAGSIIEIVKDTYFIDENNKLNFVYTVGAAGTYDYAKKVDEVKEAKSNNNAKNGNQTTSYFEQNKNLNYTSNPKDNINGKVAIIKMGEKTFQTTKNNGYYTYTDNFGNSYNIKEITNITSEYRMTSNDGATNLFRAVIEYTDNNNTKKSFDTAVFVPNDANNYTTLSIYGPYENYTGTTSFVRSFTDLYDDGSKLPNGTSKIIKQLSPIGWAGSSMQEVRLYDNGDVYHIVYNGDGNTDDNISSFKLIARNADTIEEKMNGQEFESIIVKGKYLTKVTDDGQLWILFENN